MDHTIVTYPDGTIEFIYQDEHPGLEMGDLDIRRASHVEWSTEEHGWIIQFEEPWSLWYGCSRVPGSFKNRRDALAVEVEILSELLQGGRHVNNR